MACPTALQRIHRQVYIVRCADAIQEREDVNNARAEF
jgi:hypothetical protein